MVTANARRLVSAVKSIAGTGEQSITTVSTGTRRARRIPRSGA
jgi:hypothetical protein